MVFKEKLDINGHLIENLSQTDKDILIFLTNNNFASYTRIALGINKSVSHTLNCLRILRERGLILGKGNLRLNPALKIINEVKTDG